MTKESREVWENKESNRELRRAKDPKTGIDITTRVGWFRRISRGMGLGGRFVC